MRRSRGLARYRTSTRIGGGFGGFVSGFLHPLFEPGLLLAVLAGALALGQHGLAANRRPAGWGAAGLVAGLAAGAIGASAGRGIALLLVVAVAGGLVAGGRRAPGAALDLLLALLGLGLGMGLGADPPGGTPREQAYALAGSLAGTCIWVADGALLVKALKKPWGRVLVRVFGSWLLACALLVLALHASPGRSDAPSTPAQPASGTGPAT